MFNHNVLLPSRPRIIHEEGLKGVYEIDGLYPGYGHTLGNSLRRIILSSLPGAAITSVKISGVDHEFSTLTGVKEDVITILLNLKKIRMRLLTDDPQTITLKINGEKEVTAKDIKVPSQVEVLNPEEHIATVTDKKTILDIEMEVQKGLGYVPRELLKKDRVDIGVIAVDASFTPIRRVSYEVENMRVGDRTDFNRLKIFIETDGTLTAREALEESIGVMIDQLKAIVGFKEDTPEIGGDVAESNLSTEKKQKGDGDVEFLKTRIENLGLSSRTVNALSNSNIRTVGGLARKQEVDLMEIEGLGSKGLQEIKRSLSNFGITLRS